MKTTINIPEAKLREAMKNAKTTVMRDAIETAIDDYNRRKRAEQAVASFGTFKNFMTPAEHQANRAGRTTRQQKQRNGSR